MIDLITSFATHVLVAQDPQAPPTQHWQLPVKASTFAAEHDALYTFVEWINYVFFFGIMAVLFYAVIKYRRKTPDQPPASLITHHTAMEVTWTVVPLIVVMVIFALGWKGYADMTLAPADSIQFEVKAKRWEWSYKHPGHEEFYPKDLYVPVNRPCQLTMSSRDVLHSFYVPAFRVKRDVLPGRYQTVWFQATMVGDFHIFCTEYCGEQHSKMIGTVHVVPEDEWDAYMSGDKQPPWNSWSEDPKENGKKLYLQKCSACHSTNGQPGTGPTFKGLWGTTKAVLDPATGQDVQVTVNAEYVTNSIREPNKHIVKGDPKYGPPSPMTKFSEAEIPEERIEWIVEYLKTLK